MRFLLDVCSSSRQMYSTLTLLGHDVASASEIDPKASDETLLSLANAEQRIFITDDKDFGELVFVRRLPHPCIVRFVDMRVAEKAAAMESLINEHEDALQQGTLVVVTKNRVRIRRHEPAEPGDAS